MSTGLAVAVTCNGRQRVYAQDAAALTFSSSAPGGYRSCEFELPGDLRQLPNDLQPFSKVQVVDVRNGSVVWQGRLDDPGRDAQAGQMFRVTATGTGAHASDDRRAVVYVDKRLDQWVLGSTSNPSLSYSTVDTSAGQTSRALLAAPRGTVLASSANICGRYYGLLASLQPIARFSVTAAAQRVNANLELRLVGRAAGIAGETASTALVTLVATVTTDQTATSAPPAGTHYLPEVQFVWVTGPATVGDEVTSWQFAAPVVQGSRLNADGTSVASYPADTLVAHQIVNDLLGRMLPQYDRASASVSTLSTYAIDQLTFEDGATAAEVLDELMTLDPAFYWAAWGDTLAAGKPEFVWQPWPTSVSLELDAAQGFRSPGSGSDIYNEVTVRYKDARGSTRTLLATRANAVLSAAGLTRRGYLDLGGQSGSAASAARAGDEWLARREFASNGGTIDVAAPVLDLSQRRMIAPHEIRPGGLARVRNVEVGQSSLNTSTSDGAAVFRVTATSWRDGVATLTLDADDYSVSGALAKLARARGLVRRA